VSDLVFGRAALWPWLLLLPVVTALLWILFDRSRTLARRYGARSTTKVRGPLARALETSLLLLLGGLCWLDPRLGDEPLRVERRGLDLILCLDTSRSMLASDLEPTRLQRALADIRALLPELQGGDRVGLIAFAGAARLSVPLTHDVDSFTGLLDEIDTDVVKTGGTDLAAALRKAGELIDLDTVATTVVVLLTDGEDLTGAGQQAASELAARQVVVHAIGYGSAMGSKITVQQGGQQAFLRDQKGEEVVSRMDPDSLRALAAATGGEFVRAESMPLPLRELHQKRLVPMQKRAYDAGEESTKQARYQWLLLPLLLLLLWDIATTGGRHR
jgi:Ca-activated chloride channel homolog